MRRALLAHRVQSFIDDSVSINAVGRVHAKSDVLTSALKSVGLQYRAGHCSGDQRLDEKFCPIPGTAKQSCSRMLRQGVTVWCRAVPLRCSHDDWANIVRVVVERQLSYLTASTKVIWPLAARSRVEILFSRKKCLIRRFASD